jgi:hypothetical protein
MIVLGADTHKRWHTVAAVAAGTGELLGEQTVAVGGAVSTRCCHGRAGSTRTTCGRLRIAGMCRARWSGQRVRQLRRKETSRTPASPGGRPWRGWTETTRRAGTCSWLRRNSPHHPGVVLTPGQGCERRGYVTRVALLAWPSEASTAERATRYAFGAAAGAPGPGSAALLLGDDHERSSAVRAGLSQCASTGSPPGRSRGMELGTRRR